MAKLVVQCPSCAGELHATRLSCAACATNLEGLFEIPLLLRLSAQELAFVTAFVRSSGSLKEMARLEGVSYPTVRNRLDDILAKLDELEKDVQRRRHDILDRLERGLLSAEQAERELRRVGL